jgi:hypothetical protein
VHVGFEQRDPNFPQRGLHIFGREFPLAPKVLEDALQLIA